MVSSRQKAKGDSWEAQLVKLFNDNINGASFKRVPGSGSLGTLVSEPLLMSDVTGKIEGFPKTIRAEAKFGYSANLNGEAKSISLKKSWLDKVKEEALGSYALPLLACKFDNVRSGVKYFVALDFETFFNLMNYMTDLKKELDVCYEELQKCKEKLNSGTT